MRGMPIEAAWCSMGGKRPINGEKSRADCCRQALETCDCTPRWTLHYSMQDNSASSSTSRYAHRMTFDRCRLEAKCMRRARNTPESVASIEMQTALDACKLLLLCLLALSTLSHSYSSERQTCGNALVCCSLQKLRGPSCVGAVRGQLQFTHIPRGCDAGA